MNVGSWLHRFARVFEIVVCEGCPEVVRVSGPVPIDNDALGATGHTDQVFAEVLWGIEERDEELDNPK